MKYLNRLTIAELHDLLVKKKVTALELVEEAIELAQKDTHNILEATNFEKAREIAASIKDVNPDEFLKGIPFLCKDNFATKDLETTASSNILNGYKPIFNAEVVNRLEKAGAILIAKTTLDELAMGGSGTTGHKGVTSNPYDKERLIGGSSCGSASGMASGIVPFALGSDTGDSVRKPASYGGLVGIKPSWGRISRFGLFSFATSLDTVSYFTRSVYDAAKLLEILAGNDRKDSSSLEMPVSTYSALKTDKKSILGYFPAIVDNIKDEEIKNNFKKLVKELKKKGYEIITYDYPLNLLNAIYPTYMVISCSEATSNNANLDGIRFGPGVEGAVDYEDYIYKARSKGFSDMIKRRFVIGSFSLLAENQEELFKRAQKARRLIVEELNRFFLKADALILPASPTVAPLIKSVSTGWSKEPDYLENHLGLANLSGAPSITLPLGLENGLPYGVNITSRPFEEYSMLAVAKDVEDITNLKGLCAGKEN